MEQYTFTEKEKETLEKLAQFEENYKELMQGQDGEIVRIEYFEQFNLEKMPMENVYTIETKDKEGKTTTHIFLGNVQKEILTIDSDGNITIDEQFKKIIGEIDIKTILAQNEQKNLTGISESIEPEELEEELTRTNEGKKVVQQSEILQEKNDEDQLNRAIKQEEGQDLQLTNYRKIKDDTIGEKVPALKDVEEKGIAYSKTLGAFVCITKEQGQPPKLAEGMQPAKPTMKTVISINEDGSRVKRKAPHALMKTDNEKKEMSITIGQYGYVEVGTVDRLPCNERVERQVRTQGEGVKKDGTKITFEELADKSKVTVEEFKRIYEQAQGETVDEKIENTEQEIIAQFGAPTKDRSNI